MRVLQSDAVNRHRLVIAMGLVIASLVVWVTFQRVEVSRLRESDQERREYCVGLRGMWAQIQYELSHPGPDVVKAHTMTLFMTLRTPQFLAPCGVDTTPLAAELSHAEDACFGEQTDYACLDRAAGRVVQALSR
jgi:hypothetical protein